MLPILLHVGSVTVYTYGVLVATGVLLGLWYARTQASRHGLRPDDVWNLGIYSVLVALVAAKIWLVFSAWDYYAANPREIFSMAVIQSGGTYYGGVVGTLATIVLYTWIKKIPPLPLMDTYAFAIPLGHSIGRLGCLAAGCCYGKPTSVPWAITFKNELAEQLAGTPLHTPLHPTQLYESAAEFLNFLIIVTLARRQRFTGQLIGTYFLLYGFERGTIEFFRGDPGRTLMFHNSVSLMQITSVGLILLGAFLWWRGLRGAAPMTAVSTVAPAGQ
ncbi:MAG TPA: prolipoprotein diacylglyceryl transferase [Candidatus Acidoferrum sp.]|nr:prolipoprotein diacylglyceryl transferase [Candidatus Acidoferrum sp.]